MRQMMRIKFLNSIRYYSVYSSSTNIGFVVNWIIANHIIEVKEKDHNPTLHLSDMLICVLL